MIDAGAGVAPAVLATHSSARISVATAGVVGAVADCALALLADVSRQTQPHACTLRNKKTDHEENKGRTRTHIRIKSETG